MAVDSPARPSLWTLPNQLTLSRLGLGVVLFALIEWEFWLGCIVIFSLAAVTDWLDGYFARRQGLVSPLGRMLDPLVDKVVVCGAFIFLLRRDDTGLAAWMVVIIVSRELLITGLRGFMEQQGAEFGADRLGKWKMFLQCIVLFAVFTLLARGEIDLPNDYPLLWARAALIYLTVALTALSGLQYLWKAYLLLR